MIRSIIIPTSETYEIKLPKEYLNQKIEVLVFPIEESSKESQEHTTEMLKKAFGILSRSGIDPLAFQKQIREEYERY
jgi:hypothetical protein